MCSRRGPEGAELRDSKSVMSGFLTSPQIITERRRNLTLILLSLKLEMELWVFLNKSDVFEQDRAVATDRGRRRDLLVNGMTHNMTIQLLNLLIKHVHSCCEDAGSR